MPLFRRSLLVLLLLAVTVAGTTAYQLLAVPEPPPLLQEKAAGEVTRQISVHVTGAVHRPGVVQLAEGARAQDAVEACGGLLPQADAQGVNLALVLKDGMQLRVPSAEQRADGKAGGSEAKAAHDKGGTVNINTADLQTLQRLHGIGPALAQRIIDYRAENGAFQKAEDLMQVKGIGPSKFEKMKEQINL